MKEIGKENGMFFGECGEEGHCEGRGMRSFLRSSGRYGEIFGYVPSQLRNYYDVDERFGGSGITVGIVTAYGSPTLVSDLEYFSRTFSLPQPNITVRDGENASSSESEWVLESTADSQMLHSFAPGAVIISYFAKSSSADDIFSALQKADEECDIVSLSFGRAEFEGQMQYESFFAQSRALFVCASGDVGRVNYPSSSSSVLSVGGTLLYLDSRGDRIGEESVWNESGCGISKYISSPETQRFFGDIAVLSNGMRVVPDLAFFAWGERGAAVYHSTPIGEKFGWTDVGGTSIGAPCVAGICACLAQKNPTFLSERRRFFYDIAGRNEYTNAARAYRDIILGGSGGFYAERGFDFCSGLGTPRIKRMLTHADLR